MEKVEYNVVDITTKLMQGGLTASQALLMICIEKTCKIMPYEIDGESYCILNLADLCRLYKLRYPNSYNACRYLTAEGFLEKKKEKFKITQKWYDLLQS